MKTEIVPASKVRPLDRNPRKHPERQIIELVKSIEQFGQYRPLVVDEDGVILAGNGLYEALIRLGHEKVAIHRITGLTKAQKNKLILADNRTGDLSLDDYDIVDELLRELEDFEVPGYDPDVIRELLATAEETLAEAEEYGRLDEEAITTLQSRQMDHDEQVTVGTPPPPAQTVVQVAEPAPEATRARDKTSGETYCPTCGRSWS